MKYGITKPSLTSFRYNPRFAKSVSVQHHHQNNRQTKNVEEHRSDNSSFAVPAYQAIEQDKQTEMIIYGSLALLFQPFIKVSLGRELWNVVDVIVAIGLLASIFYTNKK